MEITHVRHVQYSIINVSDFEIFKVWEDGKIDKWSERSKDYIGFDPSKYESKDLEMIRAAGLKEMK